MNGSNRAIWTNTEQPMRRKFGFFRKEQLTKRVAFRRNAYFVPAVSARYDPKSHKNNSLFTSGPGEYRSRSKGRSASLYARLEV